MIKTRTKEEKRENKGEESIKEYEIIIKEKGVQNYENKGGKEGKRRKQEMNAYTG